MAATYSVILYDANGVQLAVLDNIIEARGAALEYALIENGVGVLTLTLPAPYDLRLFQKDGRIGVYRGVAGRALALDGQALWLIRSWREQIDERGKTTLQITAYHVNTLLDRRIVAYNAGSSQASKSGAADDMIKAIVRENFISATDSSRNVSLTCDADVSAAPTLRKGFARRNVLLVLQELAESSAQAGTHVAFGIIAPTPTTLQFVTRITSWGVDRRYPNGSDPLLIGPAYGNVASATLDNDAAEEITYVYAGGQGEGDARTILTASDTARIAESPYGRIERFIDARHLSTATALADEADAAVREGRPRRTLEADATESPSAIYGVHYGWGDLVTVAFMDTLIDCRIDAVTVRVVQAERVVVRYRSVS